MPRTPKVDLHIANIRAAGFFHVADRIGYLWGTHECENYLVELLVTTRQNRQGFPPAVFNNILQLYFIAPVRGAIDLNPWLETHYR